MQREDWKSWAGEAISNQILRNYMELKKEADAITWDIDDDRIDRSVDESVKTIDTQVLGV